MRRLVATLVVPLALALGACSNGTSPHLANDATRTPSTTPTSSGSPSTTGTARSSSSPGATTGGTRSGTSGSTSRPVVTVPVTLDKGCVHRGDRNDLQGITITARPGGAAGFNTSYSDGSSSVDGKSDYQTGMGGGFADGQGHYRSAWMVPADAPLGDATVHVVAIEDSSSGPVQGSADVHFIVAAPGARC